MDLRVRGYPQRAENFQHQYPGRVPNCLKQVNTIPAPVSAVSKEFVSVAPVQY